MDVAHRVGRAQLGVGDVEEVDPPEQAHQFVPGGDVGEVVGGVAVAAAVGDRDRPVRGHGEDEQQLLEVGAEVLVVAVADRRGRFAAAPVPVRVRVRAGHGDGGGVVVQLADVDAEAADDAEHRLGEQACPVGVEEPVEHAAHPVVVERCDVVARQPEHPRLVRRGPFAQRVDRAVGQEQIAYHHADHGRRGQAQPGVVVRQVARQQRRQADAVEEGIDHRQAAEQLTTQGERCGGVDGGGPP